MDFSKSRRFYLVSRITGPTHNLLIIRLVRSDENVEPAVQMLPPNGGCGCGPLDANAVLDNVLNGAAEANAEFGTNYKVAEVRFVEDDSRNETIYAYMTKKLIEHIERGGEFTESKYGDDEA